MATALWPRSRRERQHICNLDRSALGGFQDTVYLSRSSRQRPTVRNSAATSRRPIATRHFQRQPPTIAGEHEAEHRDHAAMHRERVRPTHLPEVLIEGNGLALL